MRTETESWLRKWLLAVLKANMTGISYIADNSIVAENEVSHSRFNK
jgi:hypothetical protein